MHLQEECGEVRTGMVLLLYKHLNSGDFELDKWLEHKEEPVRGLEEAIPSAGAEARLGFYDDQRHALVFRGKVLPVPFAAILRHGQVLLPDATSSVVAMTEEARRQILVVDAYGSNLTSPEDVSDVAKIVGSLPNCVEVNLSTNRLSARCADEMKKLLHLLVDREVHCFVRITGNALASIDAHAFLRNLTEQERQHLIWVPFVFLSSKNWEALIPDDAVQLTRDTHERYFGRP